MTVRRTKSMWRDVARITSLRPRSVRTTSLARLSSCAGTRFAIPEPQGGRSPWRSVEAIRQSSRRSPSFAPCDRVPIEAARARGIRSGSYPSRAPAGNPEQRGAAAAARPDRATHPIRVRSIRGTWVTIRRFYRHGCTFNYPHYSCTCNQPVSRPDRPPADTTWPTSVPTSCDPSQPPPPISQELRT